MFKQCGTGFWRASQLLISAQILIPLVILLAPCLATAKAKLWLYPDPGSTRSGGHVIEGDALTLTVENRGSGKGDNIATDMLLLIAVNDPSLLTSITLDAAGVLSSGAFSYGLPFFPCTSSSIPPHGIFPAAFTSVPIGDLGPGETMLIEISVEGEDGLEIHFDAIATGYEIKHSETICYDVINPSGHDVDMILVGDSSGNCADVNIEKTGSSTGILIGETIEYSISVENTGTCDLTNVVISENIPTVADPSSSEMWPAFTVVTTTPPPTSQTAEMLTWELDTALLPGESVTVSLSALFDQILADTLEIVNIACVDAEELEDPVCDEFSVAVGEISENGHLGGPGYWCNRIRAALGSSPSTTFTVEELELMLSEINELSTVFTEMEDISTLELVQILLCRPNLAEGASDKLLRHLVTLWFNVTNDGRLQELLLSELCPGENEIPEEIDPNLTVGELIEAAEADLLAEADDSILLLWKDAIDFINNSSIPRADGCDPTEGQTRTQSGNRGSKGRSGGRR